MAPSILWYAQGHKKLSHNSLLFTTEVHSEAIREHSRVFLQERYSAIILNVVPQRPEEGSSGDKFYISPDKLLPLERFTQPASSQR